jgi:hypothetical protein
MRDETPEQPLNADTAAAQQNAANRSSDSANQDALPYDALPPKSDRWVPLAYDLEQNGDSGSEQRGEVF